MKKNRIVLPRRKTTDIIKEEINLNELKKFSHFKFLIASFLLKKTINEEIIDTFDFINVVRKKYNGSINNKNIKWEKDDFKDIKYNCYYLCNKLRSKLEQKGINCHYITYKASGFSSASGDDIMREAHVPLSWITKRKNKYFIVIFDPGLYIKKPLAFYKDFPTSFRMCNFHVNIMKNNDINYPYICSIKGKNRNLFGNKDYDLKYEFNPLYNTLDLESMLHPVSLSLLIGFKISRKNNKKTGAYIKLIIFSKYIEYYNVRENEIKKIYFKDINKVNLYDDLELTCKMLNKKTLEVVNAIIFLVDNYDNYIKYVIDSEIVGEMSKTK